MKVTPFNRHTLLWGGAIAVWMSLAASASFSRESHSLNLARRDQSQLSFEVASVKQNKSGPEAPTRLNVPIAPDQAYTPTGGLYSGTNVPLVSYIYFAYDITGSQFQFLLFQLPKWAIVDRFDIEARTSGSDTKEGMRAMLRSLLAERFGLKVHYETRELPVFNAQLVKSGKMGPRLQPHSEAEPCPSSANPARDDSGSNKSKVTSNLYPTACGGIVSMEPEMVGHLKIGARDVPIKLLVDSLAQMANLDRPVIDKTGFAEKVDFTFEWTPQSRTNASSQPDETFSAFLDALREQLGIKLNSTEGPVPMIVIDHVEEPTEN